MVLFLAPWPRWGRAFSAAFAGYANVVVGVLPGSNDLRFVTPTAADRLRTDVGEWTVLLLSNRTDRADAVALDTRILGYTPLAVFFALAIATPVPRRRRVKIVVGGAGLMLARLACAIVLPVARSMGASGPGWAFGPVAETFWFAFIAPPAMSYVTAALAWWLLLALTTRPGQPTDLKKVGDREASAKRPAWRRGPGKKSAADRGRRPHRG